MISRIRYNSPAVLTFALTSLCVLLLDVFTPGLELRRTFFSAPTSVSMSLTSITDYLRLVSHIFGHGDFAHLTGNFFLILLVGPLLEEKYGTANLIGMIGLTALVTGLINVFFMSAGVMGASGIVFMMILLSGFTDFREGEIPLTFILVAGIYLSGEFVNIFKNDNVSQLAHIIGGFSGSLFGFMHAGRRIP